MSNGARGSSLRRRWCLRATRVVRYKRSQGNMPAEDESGWNPSSSMDGKLSGYV